MSMFVNDSLKKLGILLKLEFWKKKKLEFGEYISIKNSGCFVQMSNNKILPNGCLNYGRAVLKCPIMIMDI